MSLTLVAIVIMGGWVVVIAVAGLVLSLRPGGVAVRLSGAAAPSARPTGPRDEIPLGGEAEVFGNVRGRIRAVQLAPGGHQIQQLILSSGIEERPVPASAILSADGQVLRLAQQWPDQPADEPPADAAVLRENAVVVADDRKPLGKLRLVCFDRSSLEVTALVVDGRGTPSRRLLPIGRVTAVAPHRITTDLKSKDWNQLEAFATDWEIRQAIVDRLAAEPALQSLARSLTIDVKDQRVSLLGYAGNRSQTDRLTEVVRSVPGTLQVDSRLSTDDDLARAVGDALQREASTAGAQTRISARFGTIDITGEAPDRATARRIESVARQVPGVAAVHNMVAVRRAS